MYWTYERFDILLDLSIFTSDMQDVVASSFKDN